MAISKGRLVGQPLLYAVSCFASLGVFLFGYEWVASILWQAGTL